MPDQEWWADFWRKVGHDSTSITGTGFKPDDPIEAVWTHYPHRWEPDDDWRSHGMERRPERIGANTK